MKLSGKRGNGVKERAREWKSDRRNEDGERRKANSRQNERVRETERP